MSYLYVNDKSYEFETGKSLLDIIQMNHLGMESPCGGKGICGKCKTKILNGDINNLTNEELKFLSDLCGKKMSVLLDEILSQLTATGSAFKSANLSFERSFSDVIISFSGASRVVSGISKNEAEMHREIKEQLEN